MPIEDVLDRLRSYIYTHDIHPTEWFEDFDKLRSGKVTPDQFCRVLNTLGFIIQENELSDLLNNFKTTEGKINYRQFCDTIQNIFSNKDLETKPIGSVVDSHKIINKQLGITNSNDESRFKSLFSKLNHQISTRGINIRECYQDFDKHNNGFVTQTQFLRSFPFKDLNSTEIQMILKRYSDPILHDVN